jgi:hypothetical protein
MTDHRTLRQRIEEHFGPPCDGKSEGICDQCQLRADILEALREAPADAPPATPFSKTWRDKEQRLVPDQPHAPPARPIDKLLSDDDVEQLDRRNEQLSAAYGKKWRMSIPPQPDDDDMLIRRAGLTIRALRAEVARLQADLTRCGKALVRPWNNSNLHPCVCRWDETLSLAHECQEHKAQRERAEAAEAQAQALRERISNTAAFIAARHRMGDQSVRAKAVLALLSPAQEQK